VQAVNEVPHQVLLCPSLCFPLCLPLGLINAQACITGARNCAAERQLLALQASGVWDQVASRQCSMARCTHLCALT
jgi:hypothetical protein